MKETKNKRPLGGAVRELLVFIERLFMVILAVSVALIFTNSFFQVSTPYGTTYHYVLSPFEGEREFEDKEIFKHLLLGNMEQITAYASLCRIMETEGEYDGKKLIDISRYSENKQENNQYSIPVEYYLDDLIAWGNYGFQYKEVTGTWQELESFFEGERSQTENIASTNITEEERTEKSLKTDEEEAEQFVMEVIIPRYKTAQGKDLTDCASSIEMYEQLKADLIRVAEQLFDDYSRYISLKKYCSPGKTNVNYCFKVPGEEGFSYYTNSNMELKGKNTDEITNLIGKESVRFIYFDPDKVQINTNTPVSAKQMRELLKVHSSWLEEGTKIWFWLEEEYPVVDSFQTVKKQLEEFKPYLQMLVGAAAVSVAGILAILLFLTKKEGRAYDEEKSIIYVYKTSDNFPMEIWTILVAVTEILLLYFIVVILMQFERANLNRATVPVLVGLIAFLGNEIGIRWYFSIIRRWKAGIAWKSTLIYMAGNKGKDFLTDAYENGGLVFRTWIPYLIFLMMNLILVLLGIGGVVGAFLLDIIIGIAYYRQRRQLEEIVEGIERIKEGDSKYSVDTASLKGENKRLAEAVNSIGMGIRKAVESSMKDEKLKTDLITNVSHDIKTPLTSIITYVDLLKRENITEQRILGYLDVLDNKSQRLKQLIDDLVEASKISSGNISFQMEPINFTELVRQALGEFHEKLKEKQLQTIFKAPQEELLIVADSSQLWRVMENLISNACKYSLSGTRIYVEMDEDEEGGNRFFIKNISETYLQLEADELTERFMRGDSSRKTEGSGLGLSIAKNLVEAMGGEFIIEIDGDLFKVIISFPKAEP